MGQIPKDAVIGGIEGGSTSSKIILVSSNGHVLGSTEGQHTNQWLIGLNEAAKRLIHLTESAIKKANLPADTCLYALGLSLSGVDREETKQDLIRAILDVRPDFCRNLHFCNDTIGAFLTMSDDPAIVVISGTGSISNYVRRDLSFERSGGYSYLLGERGSAYWIVSQAIAEYLEMKDRIRHSLIDLSKFESGLFRYFGITDRYDLLVVFYQQFSKDQIAGFAKDMAELASCQGDKFCQHIFHEAGQSLGQLVAASLSYAIQDFGENLRQITVICCGAVFESWPLLSDGFRQAIQSANPNLQWNGKLELVRPTSNATYGAARYAVLCSRTKLTTAGLPLIPTANKHLESIAVT